MLRLLALAVLFLAAGCSRGVPALPIGSSAPDFSLPGIDGRVHALADYAASPVLAVVFTCNSCPAAQQYEARLQALHTEFRNRGLALVAINPNDPTTMPFTALAHTDVDDSLDGMKARAAFRRLDYPYLSDAAGQTVARAYGVEAIPQIFVFDRARTLRYRGRIDDQVDATRVRSHDARGAIEALLSEQPVARAETDPVGCVPGYLLDPTDAERERQELAGAAVTVQMAGAEMLSALRKNDTGKLLLVNFWATWCAPCITEFPELEATYRMYRSRGLEFVAVSANDPEERPPVLEFLQKQQATHRNLLFGTSDVYGLQEAFDKSMPASLPFTLLLAPGGDVVYQELGIADVPKLRRAILVNLSADRTSAAQQSYWTAP